MRIHDYRISSKIRSTVVFRIHEQPPKTANPQPALWQRDDGGNRRRCMAASVRRQRPP